MLKQIKTKILSLISSRGFKKSLFFGGIVFIIMHFGFDTVFAETTSNGLVGDEANTLSNILKFLQVLAGIAGSLLGALTGLISLLLDPGFTNGSNFDISGYIKEVWIFVSNLIYLIFAGILITISFANIVGKGEGDLFELKKALPRFVVGVLIVPFSWWIVQLMISVSSILTVSVYTWPMETFPDSNTSFNNYLTKDPIDWCDERVINIQGNFDSSSTNTSSGFFYCPKDKKSTKTLKAILDMKKENGEYSIGGVLSIYTFGIIDVSSLTEIQTKDLSKVGNILKLGGKVIFDFIFVLMYLLILIALFLVLFVRVIMLWMYMMLSPLFGLLYFLKKGKLGGLGEKFNFKEFIGLVMVPVYVAAALSFGLMFTFIIGDGLSKPGNNTINNQSFDLGYTKLRIEGAVGNSSNISSLASSLINGSLGMVGYLMLKGFSLAFLWIAVMTAFKQSTITGSIIKPIEDFGKQVGDFAVKSPQYIPIPGTSFGGAKNQNFGSALKGLQMGMDKIKSGQSERASSLFLDEKTKAALKEIRNVNVGNKLPEVMKTIGEDTISGNQNVFNTLLDKLKVLGVTEDGLKELKGSFGSTDKVVEALTKINKENKGIITGNANDDKVKVKDYLGGGSGTAASTDETKKEGDSKIPANQTNTYNLTANIAGVKPDDQGGLKIGSEKDLVEYLINNDLKDGNKNIDEVINKLKAQFGENDKNGIINVIEGIKDKIKDFEKLEGKNDKERARKEVEKIFNSPSQPSTPPSQPSPKKVE